MRPFPSWTSKESAVHKNCSQKFKMIPQYSSFSFHYCMDFIMQLLGIWFVICVFSFWILQYREAKNMCMPFCSVMKPSMFVKWSSLGMVGFFFHWYDKHAVVHSAELASTCTCLLNNRKLRISYCSRGKHLQTFAQMTQKKHGVKKFHL